MTRLPNSRRTVPPALLALIFLLLEAPAALAETELYGGIGIGYSTFQVDSVNFEGSAYATRQFVGFTWGDYLGVETGYINFGTVNDRILDQPGQLTLNNGIETWGYNLSLVGRYPLNSELHAIAKLGMIRWDSEATLEPFPLPVKTDGDDILWGVGLDFRGSSRVHFRVEGEFVNIEFADSWWVLTTSLMYSFPFGR
ncbi:MAG: outer membrane beta-barrel protein [Chromatiales bacterium]|nr:outer membrane beta-barrel protein [Chromatiales bacterium]